MRRWWRSETAAARWEGKKEDNWRGRRNRKLLVEEEEEEGAGGKKKEKKRGESKWGIKDLIFRLGQTLFIILFFYPKHVGWNNLT